MNKYLSPALVIYSQSQVHRFSWSFTLVDDNDSIFDIQERYITLTGFTVINFEKTEKSTSKKFIRCIRPEKMALVTWSSEELVAWYSIMEKKPLKGGSKRATVNNEITSLVKGIYTVKGHSRNYGLARIPQNKTAS